MYTEKSVNGFLVGESEELTFDHANAVPGPVIEAPLGGLKIPVGIEVLTAGGADAAKLQIEYSFDGENFSTPVDLIADIEATEVGMKVVLADLTGIKAPFYRLTLQGVTSLGNSGTFKLHYAANATDIA